MDKAASKKDIERLAKLCPAGLYVIDDQGNLSFDYAGCLECGTCLVAGAGTVVASWNYPRGGMGVGVPSGLASSREDLSYERAVPYFGIAVAGERRHLDRTA